MSGSEHPGRDQLITLWCSPLRAFGPCHEAVPKDECKEPQAPSSLSVHLWDLTYLLLFVTQKPPLFSDLQWATAGMLTAWEPSSAPGESPGISHCNELHLRKTAPGEGRWFLRRLMPAARVVTRTCPQPCCSDLPLLAPELRAVPPVVRAQGPLPFHSQNPNVQTLSKKFCKIILCVATASTCLWKEKDS